MSNNDTPTPPLDTTTSNTDVTLIPIGQVQEVHVSNLVTNNNLPTINLTIEGLNKIKTFQYSKTLKCFCIFDIILLLLNGVFIYWPLIFIAFMPLSGYYGISKYKVCYINIYTCFIFTNLISKFIYFYYTQYITSVIFNIISIFINIWILELLYKFITNIKQLSQESINDLINGWTPHTQNFIFI
jgi:hypothetical protein